MKLRHLITLATALASTVPASSQDMAAPQLADGSPTWTDTTGRAIQAEFLCLAGDKLTIFRNGKEFTLSINDLSPESGRLAIRLADQRNVPTLGREVIGFCTRHLGVKVGDGQCATLAVQALAAAGARGMGRDFPKRGDYVWGRQVALVEADRKAVKGLNSLAEVKAGDIVQFRDARFEGVNRNGGGTYWMSAPHHTAVVAAADPDKFALVVYHQNWGKKIVRKDVMYLPDLKSGWLRIYRPVAAK